MFLALLGDSYLAVGPCFPRLTVEEVRTLGGLRSLQSWPTGVDIPWLRTNSPWVIGWLWGGELCQPTYHPESEAGCGRGLLIPPASWQPPTLSKACGAEPKGSLQRWHSPKLTARG